MVGRCMSTVVLVLVAAVWASSLGAQDGTAAIGTYCLSGVREVGSCIRLSPGGKFEYFLAYGAYDENSEGTWSLQKAEIVIDSLPYDKQPTFAFKRMQRGDADGFDVVVENASGRRLTYIDVRVTCDGRTRHAGVTGGEGYKIDCASAPTVVSLGLRMYGLAPQAINVADRAGADEVYVFEFDPGDLGRKKFVAHRLRIKTSDILEMVYADTPIRELEGRPFLPGSGHAINLEEPALFNQLTEQFIADVERGSWRARDPRAVVSPAPGFGAARKE